MVGLLAAGAGLLVALGVAGGYLRLVHGEELRQAVWLFDLGSERTFATWYASTLLLLSAALLAVLAAVCRRTGRAREAVRWGGLALVFALLSADEVAGAHEWTAHVTPSGRGLFYYSWVFFGLAFVAVLGVVYLPFVLRQVRRFRALLLVAALLFVGGALGVEMLNGWLNDNHPDAHLAYMLMTALEESLELAGVLVFVYALLDHLRALGVRVSAGFGSEGP